MLDKELEQTLNDAFKKAREQRHEFMTVEHLLLALLDNSSASKVLRASGANLNTLHNDLVNFIEENSPLLIPWAKPPAKIQQVPIRSHGSLR